METSKLTKRLLEILSEVFPLLSHVFDKIESSGMLVSILGSIVLNALVNKSELFRIRNRHFRESIIFKNIIINDATII